MKVKVKVMGKVHGRIKINDKNGSVVRKQGVYMCMYACVGYDVWDMHGDIVLCKVVRI